MTFAALTLFRISHGVLHKNDDLHKKMVENSAAKQNCCRHFVRYEKRYASASTRMRNVQAATLDSHEMQFCECDGAYANTAKN